MVFSGKPVCDILLNKLDLDEIDIHRIVRRMKNEGRCGLDGISSTVIKSNIYLYVPLLISIYEVSCIWHSSC